MLTKADLIHYFEQGCKTKETARIGVEHEQFVFKASKSPGNPSMRRVSYDEQNGIRDLLIFFKSFGYVDQIENGTLIGLKHPETHETISLEPGGQFELSGAPLQTIDAVYTEQRQHFERLQQAAETMGLFFLPKGFDPYSKREDVPWMPKERYAIMRRYMPTVGTMGLDMMTRTCTIQVNLDYFSEQDMAKKMRVAMALQPIAAAYFANSDHVEGKKAHEKAYRAKVWHNTDPDRSGLLPFVFDDSFSFERYVDYLLDVPMYFIKRDGQYHDVAGASFRDFMTGTTKMPMLMGEMPALKDFDDQVSIAFPEVRLKQYIELRGADSGDLPHIMAVTRFWTNILYNEENLDRAHDCTRKWDYSDIAGLYARVPLEGKNAHFLGQSIPHWMHFFDPNTPNINE